MGDPPSHLLGHEPRSSDEEALALIRELGEIIWPAAAHGIPLGWTGWEPGRSRVPEIPEMTGDTILSWASNQWGGEHAEIYDSKCI